MSRGDACVLKAIRSDSFSCELSAADEDLVRCGDLADVLSVANDRLGQRCTGSLLELRVRSAASGAFLCASASANDTSLTDLVAAMQAASVMRNASNSCGCATSFPHGYDANADFVLCEWEILHRFRDKLVHVCSLGKRNVYRVPWATVSAQDEALVNKKLHKELLLRVFSYLDIISLCRCAQVCKIWSQLAMDGSNWQSVDLFAFQKDIKGAVVENLAKRCGGFLKKLSLSGCESVQDSALRTFCDKCNFIEDLNLQKCKRITDATCTSLGQCCKRLHVLSLDCCPEITDKGLKALGDGCLHLTLLDISWCDRITDDGIDALVRGCPTLQSLFCKGCMGLTDRAVGHIAKNCHDLRVLNLNSCMHMTDLAVQYLADGAHKLEFLCVSKCTNITDRSLQALSHGCHMLKDLEVAGCSQLTDGGFNSLSKNCHDLERMDLEECSLITDQTIAYLAAGCHNLVTLLLTAHKLLCELPVATRVATNRKILAISNILGNSSFSHCELITDEGMKHLAMGLGAHDRLRELELDNCPLITDQSLDYLKDCRYLERVELYDCQLITRAGIRRFKQFRAQSQLPEVLVHAYFAPVTPPASQPRPRPRYCRCCSIL